MAISQEFIDYLIDQIVDAGEITAKRMFGGCAIYSDGKIFGLIGDGKLFIKPTKSGKEFIGQVTEEPPYEGAKPYFLIEERIEDSQWLSELVRLSCDELPMQKRRESKKKPSVH